MNRKQRIALQRQKAREALGMLRGISELFSIECGDHCPIEGELAHWESIIDGFEEELFSNSPIA